MQMVHLLGGDKICIQCHVVGLIAHARIAHKSMYNNFSIFIKIVSKPN
jgi:hypothetical protein